MTLSTAVRSRRRDVSIISQYQNLGCSGHKHACALTSLCFPSVHTRRYDRSFYGYLSGYDFELWLHLIREEVHINVAASKHG